MLRIFSCTLEMARLEDVMTLQDGWQVARYLERCKMSAREVLGWGEVGVGNFCMTHFTLSTNDRAIIFWVGGEVGGMWDGWRRGK